MLRFGILRSAGIRTAAAAVAGLAALGAPVANADDFSLTLPVRCTPGENCWVVKHVDTDPGPRAVDPMCGTLTANGHNGTDSAVRSPAETDQPFAVLAAADGRVRRTSDGMDDKGRTRTDPPESFEGRHCGNSVVIDHGDEWQTRYCHLRKGSIMVAPGQHVRRGQEIARVGLSGSTAYPHLHLTVVRNGVAIDPLNGVGKDRGCEKTFGSLWDERTRALLPYRPTVTLDLGFVSTPPNWKRGPNGYKKSRTLSASANIYLWADIFGVQASDQVLLEVFGPGKTRMYSETVELPRTQLRRGVIATVPNPSIQWSPGLYTGRVTHVRRSPAGTVRTGADVSVTMQ